MFFGALALAIGAVWPGRARAIAVAAGLAVAAWLLEGLGQAVGALDSLRPLSPITRRSAGTRSAKVRPGLGWTALAVALAILVGGATAGFDRRDVRQ